MLKIQRILLPVDFPNTSLRVVHQAATFPRHFCAEIVMLHVATAQSHASGVPEDGPEFDRWNVLAEVLGEAKKNLDRTLGAELDGLTIHSLLVKGDPARAIVQVAQQERADLIMMPSHGYTFNRFLLGSETAKVLNTTECPVWTDAHIAELPTVGLTLRQILCTVTFKPEDQGAVSWAMQMAAEFGAKLTLVHVTSSVELWGPGGSYVVPKLKAELFGDASEQLARLKKEMGTDAALLIGSGDVPKVLREAVKQTKADLLVSGSRPYGGHLRTHGYAIITAVPVPVLSV
jgi:nucleotide-binding universal stress UspA family protein